MSGAQPIAREQNPRIYQIVERLAAKANVPVPKIYFIPTDSPNAFATGRNPNHASVAVTRGILEICDDEEIEGVLAHELGHVKNRDILISAVVATIAGAITLIAPDGLLGRVVRRLRWRGRGRPARWRAFGAGHDDCGAARRRADSARHFALARVSRPTPRAPKSPAIPKAWRAPSTRSTSSPSASPCGFAFHGAPVHLPAADQRARFSPASFPLTRPSASASSG